VAATAAAAVTATVTVPEAATVTVTVAVNAPVTATAAVSSVHSFASSSQLSRAAFGG
jgi:hypothetical protein